MDEFPELVSVYQDEISWQEGEATGYHIIYGDVSTPYFIDYFHSHQ